MSPDWTSVWRDVKSLSVTNVVNSVVVNHAHIVRGQPQKKGVVRHQLLKYVNNVSCVDQLCSVKHVPNVQTVCTRSAFRGQTKPVLGNLGSLGGWTKGLTNAERGLHPPLPDQTKLVKVTDHHKLLCKSPQVPLPGGGIASVFEQKCSRAGQKSRISGLLQLTIFWSQNQTIGGGLY